MTAWTGGLRSTHAPTSLLGRACSITIRHLNCLPSCLFDHQKVVASVTYTQRSPTFGLLTHLSRPPLSCSTVSLTVPGALNGIEILHVVMGSELAGIGLNHDEEVGPAESGTSFAGQAQSL